MFLLGLLSLLSCFYILPNCQQTQKFSSAPNQMFKSRLLYQSPKPQLENGIACNSPFHSYLYLVAKPLIWSEAEGGDVVVIEISIWLV